MHLSTSLVLVLAGSALAAPIQNVEARSYEALGAYYPIPEIQMKRNAELKRAAEPQRGGIMDYIKRDPEAQRGRVVNNQSAN
ncbi:unnamed protein product [Zymoseptoria tritici ST99CH_3D1]|uniref:Uncharacterized protein n=1 Tax=Zymoseptoria tritici (strain ST99CH_3D7) TaxID=1276538 RepID=A0A1X7RVQ7_ZYMT9|nr:unnamed protein product [Zymoseptoria tritici ST99CH_3D7]SMR56002.1 unnamed protein product [Zymoseptoria tritici ST99CH_3D1]